MRLDARRIPSIASNVIARTDYKSDKKIVITAHIDAYEDTPGALDNASGIVVVMLLAEMLSDYRGNFGVEIAAFNGEDHYSVAGQMDYLRRHSQEFHDILLVVNVDDAGFKEGRTSYSYYECSQQLEDRVEDVLRKFDGLVRGEPWFNGDHMVFVQNQVPALAITSEFMTELMKTVTHTSLDTPENIDCHKLVELAEALNALIRSF